MAHLLHLAGRQRLRCRNCGLPLKGIVMPATRKRLSPIHPGAILREDLQDMKSILNQLSRDLRVPMNRISAIVNGRRSITADTAMRLARYCGTSAQYWMNLQSAYDLQKAARERSDRIAREVLPLEAA